jgi:3-oxoacyl-(acyl-carrier-protein) synthase III
MQNSGSATSEAPACGFPDPAVGIAGLAHELPTRVVTSEEVSERFVDENGRRLLRPGLLELLTGVTERRWAAEGQYSSDLAAAAATSALLRSAIAPEAVDLLIFASASHDVAEPATANRVQALTGCVNARVFDVKNACNSFVDGLDLAATMVRAGRVRVVVVATGEVLSPFIQLTVPTGERVTSLLGGLTLGDAGAAAVVVPHTAGCIAAVGEGTFLSDGSHWESAIIRSGGSMMGRDMSAAHFVSDSSTIMRLAGEMIPRVAVEARAAVGWEADAVNLVIPHQASIAKMEEIAERAAVPFERFMIIIGQYGNAAAASVPLALSLAFESGRVTGGDRILVLGGAAGFTASAMPLVAELI